MIISSCVMTDAVLSLIFMFDANFGHIQQVLFRCV